MLSLWHGHVFTTEYANDGEYVAIKDSARLSVPLFNSSELRVNPGLEDSKALRNFVRVRASKLGRDDGVPAIGRAETLPKLPCTIVLVESACGGPVLCQLMSGYHGST